MRETISKSSNGMSPCAACKLLRRRCAKDCIFAPYFPSDDPNKFASVHRVFGASNVNKLLQDLPEEQRGDAVSSMVYEANARVRDPIYGCVGAISSLQQQVAILKSQLALAQAEIVHLKMRQTSLPALFTNSNTKMMMMDEGSSLTSLAEGYAFDDANLSSSNLYSKKCL